MLTGKRRSAIASLQFNNNEDRVPNVPGPSHRNPRDVNLGDFRVEHYPKLNDNSSLTTLLISLGKKSAYTFSVTSTDE